MLAHAALRHGLDHKPNNPRVRLRGGFFPAVNEHRVVYTHFWISGKKSHKRVTTREGGIEVLVRFILISFTVQEDHADIAQPKITHEAAADIVLEDLSAGFAYLT